ncbi:ABC transporter substrate-binding protein [Thiobacter aerophilum]|uniref:ABC transporter substrate-binding protein n=1 Tax=Thiobacter aerophilum TaxID=3121275 RepID=A0ABV0ECV4_9BURK
MLLNRRRFLTASLALPLLTACGPPQPLIRVAGIVWVGYEPLFLARELGLLDEESIRLVEMPSNTASLMALASGEVEAATLTLDECLLAREGGLDVRAILVFDDSAGADVIMARPTIRHPAELAGKRIGLEETAAGALMLSKTLEIAGLKPEDVIKVPLTADRQLAAWQENEVDALVSYEPHATQLEALGARRLLDSRAFPGLIVDVLVARRSALEATPATFRALLAGHFAALRHLRQQPWDAATRMAPRMGIAPDAVLAALRGVRLMDVAANRAWLAADPPRLVAAADRVVEIMRANGLIKGPVHTGDLADPRFLPRAT